MTKGLVVLLVSVVVLPAAAGSAAPGQPQWGRPVFAGALPLQAAEATEVLTVDLNGDGLVDAVVDPVNSSLGDEVRPVAPVFLLNHGQGRFTDATRQLFVGQVPAFEWGRELLPADFNRDGRPDLFVADHGHVNDSDPNQVRGGSQQHLILSTGDGHFVDASGNLPQQLTFTHSAAVADVNGDGAPDIYENNLSCCSVSHAGPQILLNDGTGHFSIEPDAFSGFINDNYGGSHSYACTFADVNRDGSPDLIVGGSEGSGANASQVLLNDGHGHFSLFERLPPTIGPANNAFVIDMKSIDVNGDGAPDLIFDETLNDPWYVGASIQVLINDGQGHFTDETATRFPEQPQAARWAIRVLVDDLNDDGHPDLTLEYANAGDVPKDATAVYLNRDGVFRRVDGPAEGPRPGDGGPVGWVNGDGPHALLSIEFRTLDQGRPSGYFVTPEIVVPAAPTWVRATRTRTAIRVRWAAGAGAEHYQVRRNGLLIATTRSTEYIDRHPTSRPSYTIRSINAVGTSPDSTSASPAP